MASTKKIAFKNLPARCPLMATLLIWLVLERVDAPGWAWGVIGSILALAWAGWVHEMATKEEVDLFE